MDHTTNSGSYQLGKEKLKEKKTEKMEKSFRIRGIFSNRDNNMVSFLISK